jgi:hypothetical protein
LSWWTDLSDGEEKKMCEAKHMQRRNDSRAREQQNREEIASIEQRHEHILRSVPGGGCETSLAR